MIYLSFASFLILLSYVLVFLIKHGIPKTLSETHYIVKYKFMFPLMMIAVAGLLLPSWLELSDGNGFGYTFLSFLTCAEIVFVGFSPNFKDEFESKIHCTSATFAAITGILWSVLSVWYAPLISAVAFAYPLIKYWKAANVFFLEMIAFLSVYIAIFVLFLF